MHLAPFIYINKQHQPMDVEMCSINQAVNAVCRFHIINGRNVIRQRYGTQNILNSNGGSKVFNCFLSDLTVTSLLRVFMSC